VTIFQVGMTQQLEEIKDLTKPALNNLTNLTSREKTREMREIGRNIER
jgi:hypothetical protein